MISNAPHEFSRAAAQVGAQLMSFLPLVTLLAFAGSARAGATITGVVEAESGMITNGGVSESDTASGGAYVKLSEGGSIEFEVEATEETQSLTVKFASQSATRLLEVTVNGVDIGVLICGESTDGAWDSVSLPNPFPGPGPFLVGLHMSVDSPGGLHIDTMATCDTPAGQACGGCSVAPLAPPTVVNNKVGLLLPPIPGLGGKLGGGLAKKVKMSTVSLWGPIGAVGGDGECELKPKDPEKPCGETECVEKKGCNVTLNVNFYVNDYARPPFWDSTETVVFPDGTSKDYRRFGSPLKNYTGTTAGKCGKGSNVVLKFENGSITQPLSCNVCQ